VLYAGYVEKRIFEKNQIPNMTTCISSYYLGSFSKKIIYPGNIGLNLGQPFSQIGK
jgi:hypothetical protein